MNHLRADQTRQRQPVCLTRLHITLKFFFSIFLFVIILPGLYFTAADAAEKRINCSAHEGACTQSRAGLEITLDISPKPIKAMQDLVFRVSLSGGEPDGAPYIDLGMPGMNMGPNRVKLEKISLTVYEGKGVIVRCPSGRRIWQATVTVPGKGKADFIFDVVY